MTHRFVKGDLIEITDDRSGYVVALGTAMHTRDFFGLAEFQVNVGDWVETYNLNFVTVKVLKSA